MRFVATVVVLYLVVKIFGTSKSPASRVDTRASHRTGWDDEDVDTPKIETRNGIEFSESLSSFDDD